MEADIPTLLPWQSGVFQRALKLKREQRLPHAVMLETPSDFQMEHLARYLSMLLLCDQPQDISLCGTCEACRMMSATPRPNRARFNAGSRPGSWKARKHVTLAIMGHLFSVYDVIDFDFSPCLVGVFWQFGRI